MFPCVKYPSPPGHQACFLTSLQQADSVRRDLQDVSIIAHVARVHGGARGLEAAVVQLHDLLPRLQDLQPTVSLAIT